MSGYSHNTQWIYHCILVHNTTRTYLRRLIPAYSWSGEPSWGGQISAGVGLWQANINYQGAARILALSISCSMRHPAFTQKQQPCNNNTIKIPCRDGYSILSLGLQHQDICSASSRWPEQFPGIKKLEGESPLPAILTVTLCCILCLWRMKTLLG